MSDTRSFAEELADSRSNMKKVEEILVKEIEKGSTQPPSEAGNSIPEVAHALIELWKIMSLF